MSAPDESLSAPIRNGMRKNWRERPRGGQKIGTRLRERHRRWRERNKVRWKEIQRKNYEASREILNAKQREENKKPARQAYMREYSRKHRAANPEKYLSYVHNRRAARIAADGKHTAEEWRAKVAEYGGCCAYCGRGGQMTRDHDVPLCCGGRNDIANILPACRRCNSRKHDLTGAEYRARLETEWASQRA